MAWLGALIGATAIGTGWWAWSIAITDGLLTPAEALHLSTLVFTVLAFLQIGRVIASQSFRESAFALSPIGNPTLLALIAIANVAQLVVVYWPDAQPYLHTTDIGLYGMVAAVVILLATEVEKWLRRRAEREERSVSAVPGGPGSLRPGRADPQAHSMP